jgi:hypothetical protein
MKNENEEWKQDMVENIEGMEQLLGLKTKPIVPDITEPYHPDYSPLNVSADMARNIKICLERYLLEALKDMVLCEWVHSIIIVFDPCEGEDNFYPVSKCMTYICDPNFTGYDIGSFGLDFDFPTYEPEETIKKICEDGLNFIADYSGFVIWIYKNEHDSGMEHWLRVETYAKECSIEEAIKKAAAG